MIANAHNTPLTAVAPSEVDLLAQLVAAVQRCAVSLEILASEVKTPPIPLGSIHPNDARVAPIDLMETHRFVATPKTPHVCEDRDARLSDDGAWLVCSVCSKRTRYAKLEPEKMKDDAAKSPPAASTVVPEAARREPAGAEHAPPATRVEAASGTVSSGTAAALADVIATLDGMAAKRPNPTRAEVAEARAKINAAGSSEPQAPVGGQATPPAGAPSQDASKPERSVEALIESGETLTGRDADRVRAAITAEAEKTTSHGADMDAAMRERARIARGLPAPLAAKVAAMSDDEVADKDVALEIKHYASGLLTPDGFAKARTALGVKGLPTGLQLKRLAVEVLAAELDAREKTPATTKGTGSPW